MKPSWLLDLDGVISPYTHGLTTRLPLHIHKTWVSEKVIDSKGKEWGVQIAAPVLDFINDVHADGLVDIIWHTTWQHDANEISRIFGLPEFPVLDARVFESWVRRRAHGWWKKPGSPPWFPCSPATKTCLPIGRPGSPHSQYLSVLTSPPTMSTSSSPPW